MSELGSSQTASSKSDASSSEAKPKMASKPISPDLASSLSMSRRFSASKLYDRPLPSEYQIAGGARCCPTCNAIILHPQRCKTPSHCLIEYGPVTHEHGYCRACKVNIVWCHDNRPISLHISPTNHIKE